MVENNHNGRGPRRKLTDILAGNTADLAEQWRTTEAAADFAPLPSGTYEAHLHALDLHQSRTNHTPGVKLTFRVCTGEHAGRMLYHDCWLTPAALPQSKRDLQKLGLKELADLESMTVAPGRIRCRLRVALRAEDNGTQYNRVRGFEVVALDDPPAEKPDPFAPAPDADASFPFGANATAPAEATDADAEPKGGAT